VQGFTRKDAHNLILKVGTDKTRAALYSERTKELIKKFLEEAHITNKGKSAHHIYLVMKFICKFAYSYK